MNVKHAANNTYKITNDDGSVTHCAEHNREYQQILAWVEDGNVIEDEFTPAEIIANVAQEVEHKIEQLWRAATNHQNQYISDAAHAMVLIGADKSLPKCLAVKAWGTALWTEYYTRKADSQNAATDFSSMGAIPHTVQEIMEEVG